MSEELKPCPFCGEPPMLNATRSPVNLNGTAYIDCLNCNASMFRGFLLEKKGQEKAEKLLSKAWNTRAEDK